MGWSSVFLAELSLKLSILESSFKSKAKSAVFVLLLIDLRFKGWGLKLDLDLILLVSRTAAADLFLVNPDFGMSPYEGKFFFLLEFY